MTTEQRDESSNGEQFLERVAEPSPNDILCGKDKNCVHAPGSIRFRKIIESYRARYAGCLTKFDKMLITKEIYETLTQTSRFLKFNPKEKMWEEISPMAARDKCGHALRFANRTKSKASKKKTSDAQEYAAPGAVAASTSAAGPTSAMVMQNAAVAPSTGVPLATALPPLSATVPIAATPAVGGAPAPISTAAALNSVAQQVLQNAAATATTAPASVHSQQLWGELAKRYNSMWNATQIPALAQAGGLRAPPTTTIAAPGAPGGVLGSTSSAAITALAAAAAVRSNPGLLASLTAAATPPAATTAPSLAASTATAAAAAANAMRSQVLLNAVAAAANSAAPSAVATATHPRRRPTLDDLCSILNTEQVYAKNAATTPAAGK